MLKAGVSLKEVWNAPYKILSPLFKPRIKGKKNMEDVTLKKEALGTSQVVQWLKLCLLMQGAWVPSLTEELRSHMPCSVSKINKDNSVN